MNVMELIQRLAVDWGIRCFGVDHIYDPRVRALRCAEEAIELAQACHVDAMTMLRLVEVVYSRPRGEPQQELGGVFLTSFVMARALECDAEEVAIRELRRCLSKDPNHFARRNQEKLELGLK